MFDTPRLTTLKKKLLNEINLYDGKDILFHYPYRYEDFSLLPFKEWEINKQVVITGKLCDSFHAFRFGNKRTRLTSTIEYDDVLLKLTAFNQPWLTKWKADTKVSIIGIYKGNHDVLIKKIVTKDINEILGIHPVYSLKDGLTNEYFQSLVRECFAMNSDRIENFIPEDFKMKYRLLDCKQSLYNLHFPNNKAILKDAIRTMKYEEFLRFEITMQARRKLNQKIYIDSKKIFDKNKIDEAIKNLPFTLTEGQLKALDDILNDMQKSNSMYRIIQGDVGSGKTIVATLAIYACILSGYQACFMAPTEILASQHSLNLQKFFEPLGINGALLYSSLDNKTKKEILEKLNNGQLQYVVGTHSLIQENVNFSNLGLVITDEQQRFGVNQRSSLVKKGQRVDVLMLSATPIPRTLASTIYGDMDVSIIDSYPVGRKETITKYVPENSLRSFKNQLEELLDSGQQAYIVVPAINAGGQRNTRNVEQLYANLAKEWQDRYVVCYLHGKMSASEKQDTMERFKNGEINVLISTTVIEVGVDVANANIMIIYDSQMFGMSQLHQLRGRIGRSGQQGYCFLLSNDDNDDVKERLNFLASTNNGFEISNFDLQRRGPGDLLGERQSGIPGFILGDIFKDNNVLQCAIADAAKILDNLEAYPIIKKYLQENDYLQYLD